MNSKTSAHLLTGNIPDKLLPFIDLMMDLRWAWSHVGDEVWRTMDPEIWDQTENPHAILQNISQQRLEELAKDNKFVSHLQRLAKAHHEYCTQPAWYEENHENPQQKKFAYFSMEFGLGSSLPLYAGGLGILAGDYLKAASDLGVPIVAVGLLYQEGYFRQILDNNGWQLELYPYNDSSSLPIQPVQSASGAWLFVTLDFPGRVVRLRVWQAQVGRITLYLLDSNDPLNSPGDRGITSKLYGGSQELRLMQEIALGIGGWRLIEALNLNVDICHLNEGHAAFVTLERARHFMKKNNINFWQALWCTRAGNIFTTHTPVKAGFDTFPTEMILKYAAAFAEKLDVIPETLGALGRLNFDDNNEPFNMAYLAIRTCISCNGVSQLHGEVSRHMFQNLFPRWPLREVPISAITNGVHVPSWDSPWADKIWTQACGKQRWLGTEEGLSSAIEELSNEALWSFRGQQRAELVRRARLRLAAQLGQRGASSQEVANAQNVLDPNTLTLGFARRFAEYKRPNLLLQDPQRLVRLLTDTEKPVQLLIAGKAHPHDEHGKHLIQQWVQFINQSEVRMHAVFIEDYDISLAQEMVQGVDVWINTPRRPWEACGTSGMKVLVNGGLNLSELDGWWAEAYSDQVGWAVHDAYPDSNKDQDMNESQQLYVLLEQKIVPTFYDRDNKGIPHTWVAHIRSSMSRLTPQFSTNRMVREYIEQMYLPASDNFQQRCNDISLADELKNWEQQLRRHWQGMHWGNMEISAQEGQIEFRIQVYLGDISADSIQVQVYADANQNNEPVCESLMRVTAIAGATNGYLYQGKVNAQREASDFTPRIIPYHPHAVVPMECNLIHWWPG